MCFGFDHEQLQLTAGLSSICFFDNQGNLFTNVLKYISMQIEKFTLLLHSADF